MFFRVLKIVCLVAWMGLIFSFSMDNGVQSKEKSNGVVLWLSKLILREEIPKEEQEKYIEKYSRYIRKTAHFSLYFVLGILSIIVLEDFHPLTWKEVLSAIFFVFLYACSDELHQLFINERSGQLLDVAIDTIGGTSSILCYYLLRRKKNEKETTA